jgi:hypothetical protein
MTPFTRRSLFSIILLALLLSIPACQSGMFHKKTIYETTPITELLQTNAGGIWFDDLHGERAWTDALYSVAMEYLFDALLSPEENPQPPEFMLEDDIPAIVFLSVSNGLTPARVFYGGGGSVLSAFNAVLKAEQDNALSLSPETWIKIDIVHKVFTIPKHNLEDNVAHERQFYGLALNKQSGIALLPAELVAQTIIDSGDNIRLENLEEYLIERNQSQAGIDFLEDAESFEIFRFSTKGFFHDGEQLHELLGGHQNFADLSQDQLLESIKLGGDYLQKAMQANGKFVYEYLPKSDTEKPEYNNLRHAGALYAMCEVYQVKRDPEMLKAIEMGIGYLVDQLNYCDTQESRELCIVERDEVKLGANGIGLVALTKYTEVTGDQQLLPTMQSMARWILAVQNPNGEFTVHKMRYSTGEVSDFISNYYPGEALLGLIRLYQLDDNTAWADAAEKGALWLIEVRDGAAEDADLPHDHWLLYALNDIHRSRPNDIFLSHTSRLALAIIRKMNDNSQAPDWQGSFYNPPRSTPTATRGEGLNAAYRLLNDYASEVEAKAILAALEYVIRFELFTQIYGEKAMYFDNPGRIYGAFHEDLTNYSIRIDFVQHNLSSLIAYYHNRQE